MKKNIWIINHYAGQMYAEKGMRHYWIAKFLKQKGYEPLVICSNTKHNSDNETYFDNSVLWQEHLADTIDVPFLFIQSRPYSNNGKQRILNMVDFYRNVIKASRQIAEKYGKPDVIYASSVHPLTLVAGLKIAKQYSVNCVCEIRDLWPESLVAYGVLKKDSMLAKVLYAGEKHIYKKAYRIVMTWPGGYQYIVDRGWSKEIPQDKVIHISNGVDLEEFKNAIGGHPYSNPLLEKCESIRLIYTGSIRKVNNIGVLIQAVKILNARGVNNFKLFLFGDGDEKESLEKQAKAENLNNILFMGRIPKLQIPSALSKADINILHNSSTSLDRYGQSQNKFFEYLASGRPILMTYSVGYSVIKENNCGIEVEQQTPEAIADAIQEYCNIPRSKLDQFSHNATKCARQYDFKILTDKVISTIEG